MGEVLRIAANPFDGYCFTEYDAERNEWIGPPGLAMLMTRQLEVSLNFTTQLLWARNAYGKVTSTLDPATNQTVRRWNGLIGMLANGEADWSPCLVTRTLERASAVHFSPTPYTMSELTLLARIPSSGATSGETLRFNSVLLPLSRTIWLYINVLWLLYGFILSLRFNGYQSNNQIANQSIHCRLTVWMYQLTELLKSLLLRQLDTKETLTSVKRHFSQLDTWRTLIVFWLYPAVLLGWLYGGELISYLSTHETVNLINTWQEFIDMTLREQLAGYVFAGSYLVTAVWQIFSPEVARHVEQCHSTASCISAVQDDPAGQQVWIVPSAMVNSLMLKSVCPVRRANQIKTSGLSTAVTCSADQSDQLYIMGVGSGLAQGFEGIVFSKRRPDLSARMEPWLKWFHQFGHVIHWDETSKQQVKLYYSHIRQMTAMMLSAQRQLDDTMTGSDAGSIEKEFLAGGRRQLDIREMVGTYAAYLVFLFAAVLCLVFEGLRQKSCLPRRRRRKVKVKSNAINCERQLTFTQKATLQADQSLSRDASSPVSIRVASPVQQNFGYYNNRYTQAARRHHAVSLTSPTSLTSGERSPRRSTCMSPVFR